LCAMRCARPIHAHPSMLECEGLIRARTTATNVCQRVVRTAI
jgi:hypothetical protein